MTGTGKRHIDRYRRTTHGTTEDARLFSPVFARNSPPQIAMLSPYLLGQTGPVLELGAGTGQHAAAFALAFPTLDWIPSDPFDEHLDSCQAWAEDLLRRQISPLRIDAATDWARLDSVQALGPLTAIYAGNVCHIAPWEVTLGLVSGAGQRLAPEGRLFLYGPFRKGTEFYGDGNRSFDAGLRAESPDWGLRDILDISEVAARAGLTLEAQHPMPANNHLLVFARG